MDSFNVISYFSVVLNEDFSRHLYLKKWSNMTTQKNVTTNRPKKEDPKNRTKIGQKSRTKEIEYE